MSRILVTGATRGLGRALVKELSRRDHAVVATGRRLEDMADLPAPERLVLDLTNPESIHDAMAAAGRLDVVINNAAMTVSGPVEAVPASLVEQVLVTNVLGPLRVMQAALPTMRERGSGRILNISSPAGRFAPPLEGVLSASKAALEMLSEAIRFEAGHFGVQVTIVQPGTIRTEMTEREQKFELPEYAPLVKQYAERFARYRQRRAPSAEQVASEVADLVDRRSLPLRVPVGLARNGCLPGSPRACWAGWSGRRTSGSARAAPHPGPPRLKITNYGCRVRLTGPSEVGRRRTPAGLRSDKGSDKGSQLASGVSEVGRRRAPAGLRSDEGAAGDEGATREAGAYAAVAHRSVSTEERRWPSMRRGRPRSTRLPRRSWR
jgi:NAD(P)-dependent dehydrogenase (short-subunit alcohol dehydrogenase family)